MLDKNKLPKFDPDMYHKIAMNDLVVYSIHHFRHDGAEITSEDVISACFLLFPRRFSLRNYPHWPDSAVVSRRWNECRSKGYLSGSASEGFKLTVRGIKFAGRVAKRLGVAKPNPTPVTKKHPLKKVVKRQVNQPIKIAVQRSKQTPSSALIKNAPSLQPKKAPPSIKVGRIRPAKIQPIKSNKVRRPVQAVKVQLKQTKPAHPAPVTVTKEDKVRAGKFVRAMERSDAYIHYKKNGKNSKIGEFDFRSLLLCTMESSRETLVKNLQLFKRYADIQSRQDLLIFLNHCEYRFSYLLVSTQKQIKKSARKATRS